MHRPSLSTFFFFLLLILLFFFFFFVVANLSICYVYAVKKHPKLKSKYKRRVEVATKYAKTIDDFDHQVDPRTLSHHCLGPEPSFFVLRAIEIEEKKSKCFFGLLLTWIFLSLFF